MIASTQSLVRTAARAVAVAVAGVALSAAPAAAQEYKVIVNSANSTTELPTAVAVKLFLKQATTFPNGSAASPVDQAKGSAARVAFSKVVLGRPVSAVESFWQQQIFSGKDVPPAIKASDDEVVAFVKANPGAIGYVSGGAAVAGVKVVTVH